MFKLFYLFCRNSSKAQIEIRMGTWMRKSWRTPWVLQVSEHAGGSSSAGDDRAFTAGVCSRNAAEWCRGEPADVPLFRLRHHAVLVAQRLHPLHDPHGQDDEWVSTMATAMMLCLWLNRRLWCFFSDVVSENLNKHTHLSFEEVSLKCIVSVH